MKTTTTPATLRGLIAIAIFTGLLSGFTAASNAADSTNVKLLHIELIAPKSEGDLPCPDCQGGSRGPRIPAGAFAPHPGEHESESDFPCPGCNPGGDDPGPRIPDDPWIPEEPYPH